jgi:hypothetical protein
MTMIANTAPAAPSQRCFNRRLRTLVAIGGVFALGFVCGNLAVSRLNLHLEQLLDHLREPVANASVPPRMTPEMLADRLATTEGKLRAQLAETQQTLAALPRTRYLMEQQKAGKEALDKLQRSEDQAHRDAQTLEALLTEIWSLRRQLDDARSKQPAGAAREQEELEELLIRARLLVEKGHGMHE